MGIARKATSQGGLCASVYIALRTRWIIARSANVRRRALSSARTGASGAPLEPRIADILASLFSGGISSSPEPNRAADCVKSEPNRAADCVKSAKTSRKQTPAFLFTSASASRDRRHFQSCLIRARQTSSHPSA